jgi:ComF family protein
VSCGYPFAFETNIEALCGNCLKKPPIFDRAYSAAIYDENVSKLIHQFKFNDQTYLAKLFSKWIVNTIGEVINEIDYLVPVPLHKFRLLARKYNQSALLTLAISKITKIPSLQRALIKVKKTKSQTELSQRARLENVVNSYRIGNYSSFKIPDKTILLVDDVYTTGATVNECAKLLKNHGAKKIFIATIAKTIVN